jgi:hypothetical protein
MDARRLSAYGYVRALALMTLALVAVPTAIAQTDEIQVYDGSLAPPGKINLTLHSNFTPKGATTPAFPGGLISDKSFNGVPEWAWGVTNWFEAGLYLPVYSISQHRGATLDSVKLRTLFAVPHAEDRTFFYGANFEFSYNGREWDPKRFTSEIRPIVGLHLHPVDLILNPILDNSWQGGFKSLEFVPAARIAYNVSSRSAFALEEYSDYGPLRAFFPGSAQSHQIYAVVDHSSSAVDVEFGVGVGVTGATDKWTLKLILSRDLN